MAWMLWLVGLAGCGGVPREEREIWKGPKISEVAPSGEEQPKAKFLATVSMDVFVVEIPAQNIDKLDPLWRALSAKSVYMTSYNAFAANTFRVKFGRIETWEQIQKRLTDAGAQQPTRISLPIADNDTSDLPIAEIPSGRMISFIGTDLSSRTAQVGPGALMLRLRAEPVPGARGARKIIAYPTYVLPVTSPISQLSAMIRKHELYFASAAFAAVMSPGDLLVLGPDAYTGERVSLGGLFFSNPQGRLFVEPSKPSPPELKPAIRVYVLVCKGISD
jgi:hypothetical protein